MDFGILGMGSRPADYIPCHASLHLLYLLARKLCRRQKQAVGRGLPGSESLLAGKIIVGVAEEEGFFPSKKPGSPAGVFAKPSFFFQFAEEIVVFANKAFLRGSAQAVFFRCEAVVLEPKTKSLVVPRTLPPRKPPGRGVTEG